MAEKTEEQKKEEAEKERQRKETQSWLSWAWETFKDNWFLMGLVAFAGYFFGFTEEGRKMWSGIWDGIKDVAGKLFDMLPNGLKEWLQETFSWVKDALSSDKHAALDAMPLDKFHDEIAKATGVDKAVLQGIIKDDVTKKDLTAFIAKANNSAPDATGKVTKGEVNETTLKNDKTIYALMTSPAYSPLLQAVANAALKATDGKVDTTKAEPILKALRTIVADEPRFTALLTTHLDKTLPLLKQMVKPEYADRIEGLIKNGGLDANNKATPALRDLFTTMLTVTGNALPSDATIQAALAKYVEATPQIWMNEVNKFWLTDEGKALKANNGGKAYLEMEKALGGEAKVAEFLKGYIEAQKAGGELAQMRYALVNYAPFDAYAKNANLDALPAAYKVIFTQFASIPAEASAPLVKIIDKQIDPRPYMNLVKMQGGALDVAALTKQLMDDAPASKKLRTDLLKAPEEVFAVIQAFAKQNNVTLPDGFNAGSMVAGIKGAEIIAGAMPPAPNKPADKQTIKEGIDAAPNQAARDDTKAFVAALSEKLLNPTPDPAKLKNLTPDALSRFMRNSTNNAAFWAVIENLQGVSGKKKAALEVIVKNKDVINDLAKDAGNGAPLIIEQLDELNKLDQPQTGSCDASGLDTWDKIGLWGKGRTATGDKNSVGRNYDKIVKMVADLAAVKCGKLQSADVSGAGAPTPTPQASDPMAAGFVAP